MTSTSRPPARRSLNMSDDLDALLQTIHTLRSPGGCPWDRKQSLADATRYLLDEAGELLDAALAADLPHVEEEMADLLFMICFCCEILSESRPVHFHDIARLGNEKLIRRHPHVFGKRQANSSAESQEHWNQIKRAEKRAKGIDVAAESILRDLPAATAPLHQAHEYGKNAAAVGFDWPDIDGVWEKLREELDELREAADQPTEQQREAIEHEVGDLLFAVANLARHLDIQPDVALRKANQRFRSRFAQVEEEFAHDREKMLAASLDELESAWQAAKRGTGQSVGGEPHPDR